MTASRALRLDPRRRRIVVAILLVGFGCALVVYVTAPPPPVNPLGYDPADSKQYLRQMEVYGGKANVLATEFREWFDSLWHGRRLAVTVLCLTLAVVCLFLVGTIPLPPRLPSRGQKPERPAS